jgi:IS66 C-terminal element
VAACYPLRDQTPAKTSERGRLSNNSAERALRGLGPGRISWLFAGSERGAQRVVVVYTRIQTAKLNNFDPPAWLADVLALLADTPQTCLITFLPWNRHLELTRQKAVEPRPTPKGYVPRKFSSSEHDSPVASPPSSLILCAVAEEPTVKEESKRSN